MRRRDANQIIVKLMGDVLVTIGAVFIALWLRTALPVGLIYDPIESHRLFLLAAASIYPLMYLAFSLYDPERTLRAVDEYQILTAASITAGLALAGMAFFLQRDISRLLLVYFYVIQFALICLWQAVARGALGLRDGRGARTHRVLLVGGGTTARQVVDRLRAVDWENAQLIGYLTDGAPIPTAGAGLQRLGTLADVERVIAGYRVDDVLMALPAESYADIERLWPRLIDKPCNVWVVPDYFNMTLYGSRVDELGGVPMISLKAPTLTGYQRVVKRLFDLVLGSLLFAFALPVMGAIAAAIKLDSSGPVLFRQERVGEGQRMFRMFKFRSMVSGAEGRQADVSRCDEHGRVIHKTPNDPRVTRVGRFIRRTSLDELPQLINVLKGDMSLVGPRPELPLLVERYQPWQRQRFAVPQGMTGWWQVGGRSDKPMHLHTEEDLYYVRNYSLLLDLQILLKTVWVVLRGRGAY